jgi:hypothetical protein
MKRIYVDAPTLIGGVWYDPNHVPQFVQDNVADYLVSIGNARHFETKVVEVTETKKSEPAATSSSSHQGQALPDKTAKPRGKQKQK